MRMFWLLVKVRVVGLWNVAWHTFRRHTIISSMLVLLVVGLFVLLPALTTALVLLMALACLGMRRIRSAITLVNAVMATVVCLTIVTQTSKIQFHRALFHGAGLMVAGSSPAARLSPSAP